MASPALFVWVGQSATKLRQAIRAELNAGAEDAVAYARDAVDPSQEQVVTALDEVQNLSPANLSEPGSDALSIWLCAIMEEEELHHKLSCQLEQVISALEVRDLTSRVQINTLMIVSPGQHDPDSDVGKAIGLLAKETRCQHFCWVVSSGKHALTGSQRYEAAAKFLTLYLTTDLPLWLWAHGRLDHVQSRIGTLGLSGAQIPVSKLVRSISAAQAADVLAKEVLQAEPQSRFSTLARTYFERNNLTAAAIASQIGGSHSSAERYRSDFRALEELAPEELPDRIWSIYFFHALGGMTSDLHAISERAGRLVQNLEVTLKNEVDEIIQSNIRPEAAIHFLAALERLLGAERARHSTPDTSLHSAIATYAKACEGLPSGPWAAALMCLLPAFLVSYVFHPYLPLLVTLPELPTWVVYLVTLSVATLAFGGLGLLNYIARKGRFRTARQRTISALAEGLDGARQTRLFRESTAILGRLIGLVTAPDVLQARAIEFDAQKNEVQAVTRYRSVLEQALSKLKESSETTHRTNPLFISLDGRIVGQQQLSSSELAAKLVERGLHRNWRTATPDSFCEQLLGLASQGLSVSQGAAELLSAMDPQKARTIGQTMLQRADALVVNPRAASDQSSEVRFLFTSDESWFQDRSSLDLQGIQRVIVSPDRYGVFLLRAFVGIPQEAVLGKVRELDESGE